MTLLMDDTRYLPSPGPVRASVDVLNITGPHHDDSAQWQAGRLLIDGHAPIGEHEPRDDGHALLLARLIAVYGERA
jgi:hypothetical protein